MFSYYFEITCNLWFLENENAFFVILSTGSAIIITDNIDILDLENLAKITYLCLISRGSY